MDLGKFLLFFPPFDGSIVTKVSKIQEIKIKKKD